MSWTTPRDLTAQLSRLWQRGQLLRPLVTGETMFPLRLAMKGPSSTEVTGQFDVVRTWVTMLAALPQIRIEWRMVNHRVQGTQRLPQSLWIDSLDSALALIGKQRDAARFAEVVQQTHITLPVLLPWLAQRPLQALELANRWPHLLAIVQWLQSHPRPDIYLRQVDIPGVHSKFIEIHRTVLSELFDLALPATAIVAKYTGTSQFSVRYGFLRKPVRIRLRVLDQQIQLLPGVPFPDLTLDAASFAALNIVCQHVFITENETNFLAFPSVNNAIVIFGAGYGWDALARANWLTRCQIHYWGDIDTHGFAILDQLRSHFTQVKSFLMDHATLMTHETHWGEETKQVTHDLPGLTADENRVFDILRDNRIRKGLRLEQEHIGFHWVTAALRRITDGSGGK